MMLEASFVPNISYVKKTIQTTRDLVDSIENDLKDVRVLMRQRVSDYQDNGDLKKLLQMENDQLKVNKYSNVT
jgi:hypothetical protein